MREKSKHRHQPRVVGATFDPATQTSRVYRRCRCGARDEVEVLGNWWVKPAWERETEEGSDASGVHDLSASAAARD